MKAILKMTTASAALAGSALLCAPANAAYVGIGVGPVGFDIYSGGYCDRWGCPSDYWSYPIFYGPVYYDNVWYRGPVYYRTMDGERWYWIHGAWHRDQWRGPRPTWAREDHYGPALGLDYYREHGFRVSDENWRAWRDRDYRYRTEYRDNDRGGYYGNEDRYRDEDRYRNQDMDRDQYRDYDRERGTYEHSGYDRDQTYGRANGPDYDRERGNEGSDYDRDRNTNERNGYQQSDSDRDRNMNERNGYQHSDYDRDRDRGMVERSGYEHSGGASGTGHTTTHGTAHSTHRTHTSSQHHTTTPSNPDDEHGGYQHTRYDRDVSRRDQDRMRSDMDRTRPDDMSRDHGNSGASDQTPDQDKDRDRTGSENGYQKTKYEPTGARGHAKPPPVTSHSSSKPKPATNPDEENNGPSN